MTDTSSPYWTPWFNGGHWVHYGVPGSPSESVWMPVWNEQAWFNYSREVQLAAWEVQP